MNTLSAVEVQKLLGVDLEDIAYGYTFRRDTIEIYFNEGKLVRADIPYGGEAVLRQSETFDPSFFSENVKRFYRDRTNAKLALLFATFGNPLPLI